MNHPTRFALMTLTSLRGKVNEILPEKNNKTTKVALLGGKPPTPDESRACCRCGVGAPHRQHALLLFFGAGRGRGKRFLRSPESTLKGTANSRIIVYNISWYITKDMLVDRQG